MCESLYKCNAKVFKRIRVNASKQYLSGINGGIAS